MTRKIYLEGELGAKFGPVFHFSGDTVSDAIRCVGANRPDFRRYLIEAHDRDICFSIYVHGQEIECIEECLLPLVKGDVVMSPVLAGSKGGGGKILTALAIAALIWGNPAGAFIAGGQLTTPGLIAASVATNLAITGIQQLMAPDPSVDKNEESYLFNGNERTVEEGDPVPILYGELAVPGFPISFEITNRNLPRVSEYLDSDNNVLSFQEWGKEGYAHEDSEGFITQTLVQNQGDALAPSETKYARSQTVVFTDIISEGPIYGLVNGGSSVLLDNSPLSTSRNSSVSLSNTSVTFTFNGTSTVTINKNAYTGSIKQANTGNRNLVVRTGYDYPNATVAEWTAATGVHGAQITTTSGFFNTDWKKTIDDPASSFIVRLTKDGEKYFEGYIVEVPTTDVARCIPVLPDLLDLNGETTFDCTVDLVLQITSIASDESSLVAVDASGVPSGTYSADITGYVASSIGIDYATYLGKYENTAVEFRTGTKEQPIFRDAPGTGIGNISYVFTPNLAMQGPNINSTTQTAPSSVVYQARSQIMASNPSVVPEVDELRLLINYAALINNSPNGNKRPGKVWWNFYIEIKRTAADSFNDANYVLLNKNGPIRHSKVSESPISFEEQFDLTEFKPFYDFRIKINRLSDDDIAYGEDYLDLSAIRDDYTTNTSSTLSAISTIVKEPLNYPFTALARVTTNSKYFSNVPVRSYHCKGKKVLVPSNYVTRDEASDGVAKYTRNVTTGAIESSYQDWDGQFRTTKVYTNNPAWVFYDLLINKRYGLGRWIDASDIDTYALYRIARFCDELVTDGNGGEEPRFTSNVYLTKATDAYKVLKDLATTFNSIVYWLDGKITPIPDQAGDPVYNFNPSNIIDGAFVYETTGDRTRANQVIVTWNNPATEYSQEALIVEDRENILSVGKIIPEEAVAFGATSEGQAIRYGRWKLWTAKNQTELVSFKTAINAAFLMPGDVINVQDPFRYPAASQYSGRVSSTGTRTTTVIPLDRAIDLQPFSSYELSILIEEPGAFLTQATPATINGTTYSTGDLITADHLGNPITSEMQVNNLLDDSSPQVPVVASWKPYTRVETRTVTTTGNDVTSLTVSSAFSVAPNVQTPWVLRELLDGATVEGSTKQYRILTISEDSKNEYSIVAVEHYNQKFTSIDDDFVLAIDDPLFPYPRPSDDVPGPRNVYVVVNNTDAEEIDDDGTLYWDKPENEDGSLYEHVSYYLVIHNVPGVQNPLIVDKDITSISGVDLPQGTYSIGVITVSTTGTYSWPTTTYFRINDYINNKVFRVKGYVIGGISSTPLVVSSGGSIRFLDPIHDFTAPGNPGETFVFDNEHYIKDASGIPQKDFSLLVEPDTSLAFHYLYFDYDGAGVSPDTSPPSEYFKLVQYRIDNDLGIEYVFDTGDGSGTYLDNWTTLTGTISIEAGYNIVIGSGTAFTTEVEVGDYIKFQTADSPSIERAGKVAFIVSDTDLRLDRSFNEQVTAATFERTLFRVDKNKDCVFAAVRNNVASGLITSPEDSTKDNYELITDRLEIMPSYRGIDSVNSTFTEDVYGPKSLVSVGNQNYILESFKYINSNSNGSASVSSPDTSISVTAVTKDSLVGVGKFLHQEITIDDGSNVATGTLSSYNGSTGEMVLSTLEYTGLPTTGAVVSMQPALFDVDVYGKIRGSSFTYADFAKATYLADLGVDHQTTSASDIDFGTITIGGTVSFSIADSLPLIAGMKVLAIYEFLDENNNRKQYYVTGIVDTYLHPTLTVEVASFEGTGSAQGTWNISILASKLSLDLEGNLVVCGDITAFCCSDYRLKDNLMPISNAIEKVGLLTGYSFDWNSNATHKSGHDVGLVAQQVKEVLPEVVTERDNGYLAVDYARIVPLLVEAIKELKAEIEELKK